MNETKFQINLSDFDFMSGGFLEKICNAKFEEVELFTSNVFN